MLFLLQPFNDSVPAIPFDKSYLNLLIVTDKLKLFSSKSGAFTLPRETPSAVNIKIAIIVLKIWLVVKHTFHLVMKMTLI